MSQYFWVKLSLGFIEFYTDLLFVKCWLCCKFETMQAETELLFITFIVRIWTLSLLDMYICILQVPCRIYIYPGYTSSPKVICVRFFKSISTVLCLHNGSNECAYMHRWCMPYVHTFLSDILWYMGWLINVHQLLNIMFIPSSFMY